MMCRCGCGETTPIAKRNRKEWGYKKGERVPYIRGHNSRIPAPEGHKVCTMCRQTLPTSEFYGRIKLSARCKPCARSVRSKPRKPTKRRVVDPEKNRARVKAWREANRDKRRAQARKEAHTRRCAAYTEDGWFYAEEILRRDPCSYCGEPAGTIDHITAVHRGGDGDWVNLTAACLACNSGKGPKNLLEYLLDRRPA